MSRPKVLWANKPSTICPLAGVFCDAKRPDEMGLSLRITFMQTVYAPSYWAGLPDTF
jgi:hypothetical protein